MTKELQKKLTELFGDNNLENLCRLKVLENKLKTSGQGLSQDEYEEYEDLQGILENIIPQS